MSLVPIRTVVSEAFTRDLIGLAEAKEELKIADTDTDNDAWLARVITQSSAQVENYCNRVFAVESIEEIINLRREHYRRAIPDVAEQLQLWRWPLDNVQVIETIAPGETQTLAEDTDYVVERNIGQLIRLATSSGQVIAWNASMPVTVSYIAGYNPIPADVVAATLRLVVGRWFARARDPLLLERNTPMVGTERYWVGGPKKGGSLPQEVSSMLDQYRVPVTA